MKAKATHTGTCPICGSVQKLPNGKLSSHGYRVTYGIHTGRCYGSNKLPFELDCKVTKEFLEDLKKYLAELEAKTFTEEQWRQEHMHKGTIRKVKRDIETITRQIENWKPAELRPIK